jgi:hypothetical protein
VWAVGNGASNGVTRFSRLSGVIGLGEYRPTRDPGLGTEGAGGGDGVGGTSGTKR